MVVEVALSSTLMVTLKPEIRRQLFYKLYTEHPTSWFDPQGKSSGPSNPVISLLFGS
jgi:hypothetical protein